MSKPKACGGLGIRRFMDINTDLLSVVTRKLCAERFKHERWHLDNLLGALGEYKEVLEETFGAHFADQVAKIRLLSRRLSDRLTWKPIRVMVKCACLLGGQSTTKGSRIG
ncbi:hypothetical protein TIFTF001_043570 [Ficus carica]|uniref:Uncharacterized protein n=1 Tax=Ficus carica TaxID=3494 RepID=A0AA88CIZ1_FICCA|nr:hypothetical protein TIFTF001_043570 [Ficus carica]